MTKQEESDTLSKIEENQVALRDSIEIVKKLAHESDLLLKRHRKAMNKQSERRA